jgi:hypothetical protein
MTRWSAAALAIVLGAGLGGCTAQALESASAQSLAHDPVFADVDCRATNTGTVTRKQNCNDLEVDDRTGAIVTRSN